MKNLFVLIIMFCCLGSYIYADVTITSESTTSSMGMVMHNSITKTYMSSDKTRLEISLKNTPAIQMTKETPAMPINITRYDKGINWMIFDIDSSYAETILSETKEMMEQAQSAIPKMIPDSVEINWEIISNDLGDSLINGFKCKGMSIKGEVDIKVLQRRFNCIIWTCDDFSGHDEIESINKLGGQSTGVDMTNNLQIIEMTLQSAGIPVPSLNEYGKDVNGQMIISDLKIFDKYNMNSEDMEMAPTASDSSMEDIIEQNIDTAAGQSEDMFDAAQPPDTIMEQAMEQFLKTMEEKFKSGGFSEALSMTIEVKSIETSEINPDMFEIPAGYKKN